MASSPACLQLWYALHNETFHSLFANKTDILVWRRVAKYLTGKDLNGTLGSLWRDLEVLRAERDDIVEQHALLEEAQAQLEPQAAGRMAGNGAAGGVALAEEGEQGGAVAAAVDRPQAQNAPNNDNNNNNIDPPNAGRVLSITFGVVARNLLSSLIAPFIGHAVGQLLHRWALSGHLGSAIMGKILGVGLKGRISSVRAVSRWWGAGASLRGTGPLMPIGLHLGVENLDPIWYVKRYFRISLMLVQP